MLLISEEVLLKQECAAHVSRGVTKRTIALEKQKQEKIDSLAIFRLFVLCEIIQGRGDGLSYIISAGLKVAFFLCWELFVVPKICVR